MEERQYRIIILEEGTARQTQYLIRHTILRRIIAGLSIFLGLCCISFIINMFVVHYYVAYKDLQGKNQILMKQTESIGALSGELEIMKRYKLRIDSLMGIQREHSRYRDDNFPADTAYGDYAQNSRQAKILIDKDERDTLRFIWPAHGIVTNEYSESEKHFGLDIALTSRSPIRSAESGVVLLAGTDPVFGKTVIIQHTNNISSIYGHNDSLLVENGQQIIRGQIIALSGNTGKSTAPHLHFGISTGKNKYIDPKPFLN
ncbi:MAG: M23 family metallopeptidase [Candidatus Delongbacteria bacterium]|nr:M23 family metallopeptidase [Candidatus Delongbacteria bacterium]